MNLGIVGHGAEKFTVATAHAARRAMREAATTWGATAIVSGHSPLGGVDIWAEELAVDLAIRPIIHAPMHHAWAGPGGYQARNFAIARDSDVVLCVVGAAYPPGYAGMRFERDGVPICYHCRARIPTHVKSGGCWTAWKCKARAWAIVAPTGAVAWHGYGEHPPLVS